MAMTDAGGQRTPDSSRRSLPYTPQPSIAPELSGVSWVRNWASHDWIILSYFAALIFALCVGTGPNRSACIVRVAADAGAFAFVLALVRGNVLRWGTLGSSLRFSTARPSSRRSSRRSSSCARSSPPSARGRTTRASTRSTCGSSASSRASCSTAGLRRRPRSGSRSSTFSTFSSSAFTSCRWCTTSAGPSSSGASRRACSSSS